MLKGVVDSLLCDIFKLRLAVLQTGLSVKSQTILLRASPAAGNSQTSLLQKVKLTGIVLSDSKTYEIYKAAESGQVFSSWFSGGLSSSPQVL